MCDDIFYNYFLFYVLKPQSLDLWEDNANRVGASLLTERAQCGGPT